MPNVFVGIDPGANGGLAFLGADGQVVPSPLADFTPADLWEVLRVAAERQPSHGLFAVVEKVGGYHSGAGFKAGSAAMFNFGKGVGLLLGFLTAARVPFEEVTPQRWQKALGVTPRRGGEGKTHFKNRLKALAQQLFPREKVTLATADALLLAEYARRTYGAR